METWRPRCPCPSAWSPPVLISSATEDHTIRLHEVHRGDCGGRLRHRRVCELDGQEVAYQDVARGVERPDGMTVVLDDDALEGLPLSTKHLIEVLGFVAADTIDPISHQRAYYARPANAAAERPYEVPRRSVGAYRSGGDRQDRHHLTRAAGPAPAPV